MTEFLVTAASVIIGVVAADTAAPQAQRFGRVLQDAFVRWLRR